MGRRGGWFEKIDLLITTTPALRATPPRLRRGVWRSFRLYVQSLLDGEIDQFVAYARALNFDSSDGYREAKPSRTRAARVQEQNTAPDFRQWLM